MKEHYDVIPVEVHWTPVLLGVISFTAIAMYFTSSLWIVSIGSGLLGTAINELIIWRRDKSKPKELLDELGQ